MNPITLANLDNFCRVCLREQSPESRNTFDKPLTTELVKIVTCITIEQALLTQVCQSCAIRVTALYAFREKAIVSTGICKMLIAEYVDDEALPRLKSYCRVCLQRRTGKNEDRFSFEKNPSLCKSMLECTGLQIKNYQTERGDKLADDERFPDVICEKCYIGFSNFAEIRSLASLSEEYVRNLLNENMALKQEKQEPKEVIKKLPEQCETIGNSLKVEVEEFNIKVEPLDFLANEVLEDVEHTNDKSIADTREHSGVQNELSEEEINNVFYFDTHALEHSATTEESDKLSGTENSKNILRNKKIAKTKRKQLEPITSESNTSADDEALDFLSSPEIKVKTKKISRQKQQQPKTKVLEQTASSGEESDKLFSTKTEKAKDKTKKSVKIKRKQLECTHCGKKFRNRVHFEGHVKGTHEGIENPFNCHVCNDKFPDYHALQRHITRKHKANDATKKTWKGNIFDPPKKSSMHVCLQCNRQFTRKSHLEEHMNSVHLAEDERPFRCRFCQKTFGSGKTLQRHEKNHSSEKPFACEFCPKRYNIKADFNAHMQRHSCTDTSLLCPICKRLKSSVEELEAHVEMHMKSRQHQCTTCGKIFTKLFHLKEHETSVHLKLRPFKCNTCEKTFATQRSQKEHEQLHDPNAEKKVICDLCEMSFINRKQLSYHKAKEHKTKEQKIKESARRKKSKKNRQNQGTSLIAPFPLDWLS